MELEVSDTYSGDDGMQRDIYTITINTIYGTTVMNNPGYSSRQNAPDFPESPNAIERPRCHSDSWMLSEDCPYFDAFDDAGNFIAMDWMLMDSWDLQSDFMVMDFYMDFLGAGQYVFGCCDELYGTVSNGNCEEGVVCDCDGNVYDCAGTCGGDAVADECGECGGEGLPECDGNDVITLSLIHI